MATNSTATFRCGPTSAFSSASNSNGGGFDSAISGAGTDYTNPANITNGGPVIPTFSDLSGSGTGPFTTAALVTTAMIGNAIFITGGGATAGWYFISAVVAGTSISLTATPGTLTNASGTIGGMWADFYTNTLGSNQPFVPGNICYVRGTGSGSKASPDFTVANASASASTFSGNQTNGWIKFVGETNRVYIKDTNGQLFHFGSNPTPAYLWFENAYYYQTTPNDRGISCYILKNVIFDQNGLDSNPQGKAIAYGYYACELLSSVARAGTAANAAGFNAQQVIGCNAHDITGPGVSLSAGSGQLQVIGCTIHNCSGKAIDFQNSNGHLLVAYNTIDSPGDIAVNASGLNAIASVIVSNIITNVPAGKFAIVFDTATFCLKEDSNLFFNCPGGTVSGLTAGAGPNDQVLGASPYASGTENWALSNAFAGVAFPQTWKQSLGTMTAIVNKASPGAIAP